MVSYPRLNDNVPFLELLSTLAHETVHVVQFLTGRLRIEDEDWIWEGIPLRQKNMPGSKREVANAKEGVQFLWNASRWKSWATARSRA